MRQFAPVKFNDVKLEGAFWKERLDTVLRTTIPSQHEKLGEYKILKLLDLKATRLHRSSSRAINIISRCKCSGIRHW